MFMFDDYVCSFGKISADQRLCAIVIIENDGT